MDKDKRAVPDLSEGEGLGGEVPEGKNAGDKYPPNGDASPEQEGASPADNGGRGDATAESDEEGDLKEALAEEPEGIAVESSADRWTASERTNNEGHEVPRNPSARCCRIREAITLPTPPTTYRRLPFRSRMQYNPTRFIAARAGPARTRSAMSTADQGAMNKARGWLATCSEFDATVNKSSSDEIESATGAMNEAASSSSFRLPSRSRKKQRPNHFVPEEAEAAAPAKALRSDIVLDRFLTFLLRVSPQRWPEWVREVTAGYDRGLGQDGADGSRAASGESPEEPDDRAAVLTVVAVLGSSLALYVVSCVLFYIMGQ